VQAVYTHEDEGSIGKRTDSMGVVIHAGRISEYLEGECIGGSEERIIRI